MPRRWLVIGTAVLTLVGCSGATPTPVPSASGIVGFGATTAAWNATHTADTRYAPGSVFDPIPGLGPDDQHDAKYYAVVVQDGRVVAYSERLPQGSLAQATDAALLELPTDGKVLWTATRDTCAQMDLQSDELAKAMGGSGMVFVEVTTGTAAGGGGYDPKNANELFFMLGDYPTEGDAPGC